MSEQSPSGAAPADMNTLPPSSLSPVTKFAHAPTLWQGAEHKLEPSGDTIYHWFGLGLSPASRMG